MDSFSELLPDKDVAVKPKPSPQVEHQTSKHKSDAGDKDNQEDSSQKVKKGIEGENNIERREKGKDTQTKQTAGWIFFAAQLLLTILSVHMSV